MRNIYKCNASQINGSKAYSIGGVHGAAGYWRKNTSGTIVTLTCHKWLNFSVRSLSVKAARMVRFGLASATVLNSHKLGESLHK